MPDDNQLIDPEQIENLRQLFNEGFKEFAQAYLDDFEQKEKELSSALKEKQIDNIVKIAHALKGNSLNMGAGKLGKACFALEMAGKKGSIEEIMTEFDSTQQTFEETKAAFLKIL